jgi:hypothetical protein
MLQILIDNLLNPALLFFVLGIAAAILKSDLSIPDGSSKFISIYLLFSIGFNGGQELSHSIISGDMISIMIFSILLSLLIPIYVFFFTKNKIGVYNAGAVSASYGSVSAVTFITAVSFLQMYNLDFDGYMVASLAFMEAPAIIMGVLLTKIYSKNKESSNSYGKLIKHSLTNGSVLLILGSLTIGFLCNDQQAMDIKPFTTDMFKGFLAVFLLDMGIHAGKKLKSFIKNGWFTVLSAIGFSLFNGIIVALLSGLFVEDIGNRFLLTVLSASASYIAVPAAMRISIPKSDPGIYLPMALAISFPFNITIGFPIYYWIISIV